MKITLKTTALISAIALLSACASTPTMPFKQKADFGSEVAQVSKDWKKGETAVEKGEKLVKEGNKLIRKGNNETSEGRADERKAKDRLTKSRRDYDAAIELSEASDATSDEMTNPKVIKSLAKTVASAETDLRKSEKKQRQGSEMVSDGKSKIKKGEKLIREGRDRMENAEDDYRDIGS